jgi:virulence-associated protein VagC
MTTTLFMNGRSQAVRWPSALRMPGKVVSIRKLGNGLLLEPVKADKWPEGWLESIHIEDSALARPDQGVMPPPPEFEK